MKDGEREKSGGVENARGSFVSARGELSRRIAEFEKVHSDLSGEFLGLAPASGPKIAGITRKVGLRKARRSSTSSE